MADMSLDDIIKKKKMPQKRPQGKMGLAARGGVNKNKPRPNLRPPLPQSRKPKPIADARFKIIQKNRAKLTDARDKLAEIAKQSDARLKLEKLRASQKPSSLPTISRKTGRNGKISLTTTRIPPMPSSEPPPPPPPPVYSTNTRIVGYRPEPPVYLDDMGMDWEEPYAMDTPIRRTVSNEYAPGPPPPPPVFGIKPPANYSWPKATVARPVRKPDLDRPREYKVVPRLPMGQKVDNYRDDWDFPVKTRTIVNDQDKYFESRQIKSRLESANSRLESVKPRQMTVVRPKTTASSQPTGYRIVVSNLQANVTQEDIKELFEDVGELLVSRLVRPGTAEVIYKTMKDATKAVETYHNRQLDGHPMKCLLVNPRPKNNPTAPAVVRPLTESRRATSSSYVQPSLGTVHRALFDDCRN